MNWSFHFRMVIFLLVGAFLPFALPGIPLTAQAEAADGAGSLKLGFVNLTKVFDQYEGTKSTDAHLGETSESKRSQREQMVSEIKNMREELVLLNEESRSEKQKAIEEKMRHLAEFDRQTRDSLRHQRDEGAKKIFDEIEATVSGYAKEHGFSMILTDREILYGAQALDVTEDVLKLLNDRYKKQHP